VPEKEFEETEHKAAALRRAIEEAVAPAGRRSSRDTGAADAADAGDAADAEPAEAPA
jgi:hypothetical protein